MTSSDRSLSEQEDWHARPAVAVEEALQTRPTGLSEREIQDRLARYGPNRLVEARRQSAFMRLLRQFHNILLYVMMASAVVTALLGHWIDTGVLMAAVVVNAIIGFIQEGKAESAMDAIRGMLSPRAVVLRDGTRGEIDAAGLVPGDQVLLVSGDRVPADLRLVETKELRVEEAALTGESLPVEKLTSAVAADAPLGDRQGMAYSGTVVVHGQARGVVVATGAHTELGRINQLLSGIGSMTTPLLRQVDHFGRVLAVAILALSALLFVAGTWWLGHAPEEMFMMVVALAASAIPEGLPAIMTVTLALAAHGAAAGGGAAAAGGRGAGVGDGDLLRQDGHADPQRDDGAARGCARARRWTSAAWATSPWASAASTAIPWIRRLIPRWSWPSAPACCATTRRCARKTAPGGWRAIPPRARCWCWGPRRA
nr:HAD-IC family P-type ATPase [Achromobacter denitrificans]